MTTSSPRKNLKRKRAPFLNGPSRIIPQSVSDPSISSPSLCASSHPAVPHISTCPPPAPTSSNPVTTLLLSLPLAQRIHNLILTSREIEALWRGWFAGPRNEDMKRKMSDLEVKYDELVKSVEEELEGAWVDAGFLPRKITPYSDEEDGVSGRRIAKWPTSRKTHGSPSQKPRIPVQGIFAHAVTLSGEGYFDHDYSVDKELRQQRDFQLQIAEEEARRDAKRAKYSEYSSDDDDDSVYYNRHDGYYELTSSYDEEENFEMAKPIEIVCMVPLSRSDRNKLKAWSFRDGKGRKGKGKAFVNLSPRGTTVGV
ncbi:hypothetical protein P280DRAFT_520122 [Massarina eburnea CBS 473.64]|uniref:Uncharacterized protein n=1 Tax=Massarina eburnea CBS 473.64 TaxID=1395130 RepID=A0A6A6RXI1_9PLEO|nr:hypothetical protein P280DRAFT_520122 [Massarina eburnea CBS 473.64]